MIILIMKSNPGELGAGGLSDEADVDVGLNGGWMSHPGLALPREQLGLAPGRPALWGHGPRPRAHLHLCPVLPAPAWPAPAQRLVTSHQERPVAIFSPSPA